MSSRFITPTANGWWVRVSRRDGSGKYVQKSFAASKYGGWVRSLEKAIAWRDELAHTIHGPGWHENTKGKPRAPHKALSARNTSGFTGVQYRERVSATGRVYQHWLALWRQGGKVRCKTFSVREHGSSKEARRLAVEYRMAMLDVIKKRT